MHANTRAHARTHTHTHTYTRARARARGPQLAQHVFVCVRACVADPMGACAARPHRRRHVAAGGEDPTGTRAYAQPHTHTHTHTHAYTRERVERLERRGSACWRGGIHPASAATCGHAARTFVAAPRRVACSAPHTVREISAPGPPPARAAGVRLLSMCFLGVRALAYVRACVRTRACACVCSCVRVRVRGHRRLGIAAAELFMSDKPRDACRSAAHSLKRVTQLQVSDCFSRPYPFMVLAAGRLRLAGSRIGSASQAGA